MVERLWQDGAVSRVTVITGMSGGGRSVAAGALQDMGWFVIDNLPGSLVSKVGELAMSAKGGYEKVALVMAGYDDLVSAEVQALRSNVQDLTLVFLEASTDVLVRRYESTKRRHPLVTGQTLTDAIEQERELLVGAREAADLVIDTSDLNPHELRERLASHFRDESAGDTMRLTLESFGFKHGLPRDVDMVFDVRFLPNPYWDEELKPLSGKDPEIQDYVIDRKPAQEFLDNVETLLTSLLPAYEEEGKSYLTIAFGCTGGRHRSVAVTEIMAHRLNELGWRPSVVHRDVDK